MESFEIQDDDIFIITYPKSGTIWTQNIVSLILHEGHRDGTENITLIDRTPWLECNIFHIDFSTRPSPCLFTSHLPYYLVPKALQNKTGKIIYVFRNPKDVLVSTYHFTKITPVRETPKDFDTFLEWFLSSKGKIINIEIIFMSIPQLHGPQPLTFSRVESEPVLPHLDLNSLHTLE
uniref:Sulfotransferase n=1 Tax=Laticauda laticaudata TaxID=8630 RepID=A0A8C5RRM7_LATLA